MEPTTGTLRTLTDTPRVNTIRIPDSITIAPDTTIQQAGDLSAKIPFVSQVESISIDTRLTDLPPFSAR